MDIKKVPLNENNVRIDLENLISPESPTALNDKAVYLKKFFNIWQQKVQDKRIKNELVKVKLEQREKLDNLVKALRKHQKQQQLENEITTKQQEEKVRTKSAPNNYKNRFEAQKVTIEKLTTKLEEKDKLIEELQLGIFQKDALKLIDNSKNEIREIFADCSAKTRCKLPPPVEYNEQFMVSTQKAPKIIQKMEARALERAKKHEIIQQRKKIIEEKRRRIMQEALEKKRIQDEEEKKRQLEMLKERRRAEMEQEKIRQANKQIYLEKLNKACHYYDQKLIKTAFESFRLNHNNNKINEIRSQQHYKFKLLTKTITKWKDFVEAQYEDKYLLADALFAGKILHETIRKWKEFWLDCVRSRQVAEDFSDLRLQSTVFVHWHRYVCTEIVRRDKLFKLAKKHYERRIVFHYFYQWRSLPAVMQLERAKEEKKRKWREKVMEILPDYKPPQD